MGILDVPGYSKSQSDAKYAQSNKVLPGRYTLPKRTATDGLKGLTPMTNPPTITKTTAATITNSVLVYPGTSTGTGSGFNRAFDASKSPYFLYHGNVMRAAGTSIPDYSAVQGSLNNGYPFDGGSYSVEFDYDGSQFEIACKDVSSSDKGMIYIDGQPVNSSYVAFGATGSGSTYRTLVKFVDPAFTPLVVTAASSNNTTTTTYTVTNPNSTLAVGNVVSITGIANPFNLASVPIDSVTSTQFTVLNAATSSITSQAGTAKIGPGATVNAAVGASGTVTYTTSAAHGFSAGQRVTVTGLGSASGSSLNLSNVTIATVSSTQFTVSNSTVGTASGTGTANAVATVTAVVGASGTVTYTTSAAHGFSAGQTVTISGTVTPLNLSGVTVASVTGTTTFTVQTLAAVATASIGTLTGAVAKEVRNTRRVTLAFSAAVPFYGIYRQSTASIYKPPSKITSILWQGDSFTESTGSNTQVFDGYPTTASKLLGIDEIINVAQGGTGFLAISDTQSTCASLSGAITASATTATVSNISDFGTPTYPFNAFIGAEYVTVSTAAGNVLTLTRGINYGTLPTVAEAHYSGDAVVRGSRPIFRARNFTDLSKLTKAPDIIAVAGGHNDLNYDATRLATEILTYFRSLRTLFPNAIIIGLSALPTFGVELLNVNWFKATDAIKTAMADSQVNGIFINLLELPLRYTPASTTLSSAYTYSTSNYNIVTTNYISVGATVELGSLYGTWGGRRVVTAISGSGPYTLTLNKYPDISLASTTAVTEVGPCIFTGTGYISNQNNSGNTDFMIIFDGAHPSPEGHRLLAEEFVNQLINTQITTRL